MLIKTITMETEDNQLFSKTSPLLPAAVELAFHTVNCSALNAEELRRDNGMEVCMPRIEKNFQIYTKHRFWGVSRCSQLWLMLLFVKSGAVGCSVSVCWCLNCIQQIRWHGCTGKCQTQSWLHQQIISVLHVDISFFLTLIGVRAYL